MDVGKLGKYEVRRTIGRGAVGVVYEAWDPLMARTVAIKVLPLLDMDEDGKHQYERFKREAQAAGRLQHPNIVSAFDYGETDASAYIVMEFLPGPSLKALLARHEPLPLPRIGAIMHGLLAALQHSHDRGVVHRDIKPANVVFAADGEVKLTDFGIAHLDTSGITRAGSVLGTPAYMAPEQVRGEKVDRRTDLFSAGVLLYEMLTGRRPFEGSTASVMHKIVHLDPPRPSQLAPTVSPGLDAVITRAIAKDPAGRFQSAAAFDAALHVELQRVAPSAVAPSRAADTTLSLVAPPARPRRRTWLLPSAGIMAAAALAGWMLLPRPTARDAARAPPAAPGQVASNQPAPGVAAPPVRVVAVAPPRPPAAPAAAPPSPHPPTSPPSAARSAETADPALREQVQQILASAPCSVITSEVDANHAVRVHGVSALGDASELEVQASLQRAIRALLPGAAVSWNLARIEGPYCPVLDLFRPLHAGGADQAVTLSLPTDHADGLLRIAVEMRPHADRLLLDLFAADGSVRHLHAGAVRDAMPFHAETHRAASGDQLVTALVTPTALLDGARPEQEPAASYLKDLQAALDRASPRKLVIAADVLPLRAGAP